MGSFSTEAVAVSSSGSSCFRHSSSELSFSIFLPVESEFCFFSLYNRTETRIASNENENTATNLKIKNTSQESKIFSSNWPSIVCQINEILVNVFCFKVSEEIFCILIDGLNQSCENQYGQSPPVHQIQPANSISVSYPLKKLFDFIQIHYIILLLYLWIVLMKDLLEDFLGCWTFCPSILIEIFN